MNTLTLILFALCGVFICSVAIVFWKKGFWPGLAGTCAFFLALCFALRYDVAAQKVLIPLEDMALASMLVLLLIGSIIFGIITSRARPLKFYFSKKWDKIIAIVPLAVMTIVCVSLITALQRYELKHPDQPKVVGPDTRLDSDSQENQNDAKGASETKSAKTPAQSQSGESVSLRSQIGEINNKLGHFDGIEVIGLCVDIKPFFSPALQIALVLVFCLWVTTGAWVAEDVSKIKMISQPTAWKLIFALVYPIGMTIGILLPIPFVDALILITLFLVPTLIYVAIHNKNVPDTGKVLTPDHLSRFFGQMFAGKKKKGGRRFVAMTIIDLSAYGKTFPKDVLNQWTEAARSLPGYTPFGTIVNNALLRRATMVEFTYNSEQNVLKYFIDGIWHPVTDVFRRPLSPKASRELCTSMRAILGDNSPLEAEIQRRSKQEKTPKIQIPPKVMGQFFIEYDKRGGKKRKMGARLVVQTKGSGESAMISFERLTVRFGSYEKMRVGAKRAEQMKSLLGQPKGLIVFAAPPGQGLRTFTDVSFCETDRFTRDVVTVEDIRHPYMPIENLHLTTYDSAKGESPLTVLPGVFFKEPKLLLIRDIVNKETLQLCCDEIQNERMIATTLRAKTSAEALMLLLQIGIDPKVLADSLTAIFTQRLIRFLCPKCKEEIPATEEMCRRIGIPRGRVKSFWRRRVRMPPEPGKRDLYVPCRHCMDIGYFGRAGLYDVIVINDQIRQIMTTKPSEEAIRHVAMKSGGGSFTADGVRMIVEGLTSFEELARVLKL
ncbi:MAG: ATPase, T2SS/T4P/T4SS family [Thermoguttaceae bacterium]|jgi:general secretion pathway protein E